MLMAFKGPRLLLGGALVVAIVLAAATVFTSAGGQRLGPHSRDLLEAARAAGNRNVTLLVATAPADTRSVAARLASFGMVRYEDDDLGYVRVVVPTEQAEAAAAVDGIQGVEIDETVPLPDPRPDRSEDVAAAWTRFKQAGLDTRTEENTSCCYALQDKVWVADPDGNEWEVFVVKSDTETMHDDPLKAKEACCVPQVSAQPKAKGCCG
jgi:hypothetical protein